MFVSKHQVCEQTTENGKNMVSFCGSSFTELLNKISARNVTKPPDGVNQKSLHCRLDRAGHL